MTQERAQAIAVAEVRSGALRNDSRQAKMWAYYSDPDSKTFGNAMQSALSAGYAWETSNQITKEDWFKRRLGNARRSKLLNAGEKKMQETLEFESVDKEGNPNVPLLGVQTKVAVFLAETLGRDDYHKKTEQEQKVTFSVDPFEPDQVAKLQAMIAESDENEIINGEIIATEGQ